MPPGANTPPSLVIRPFHQAGRVVSLREFSNNAFNHHHGIQSSERFGAGTDPDGAASRAAFQALPAAERNAVIELLKSLQVLPEGARFTVVDERGRPRPEW